MAWRSDDLVTAARLRCRIPDGDSAVSDAEIRSLADEELSTTILPHVRRARAEFYVASTDVTVDGSTDTFRIPSRAQSGGLRDVVLVAADGTGRSIPRVPLEERDEFRTGGSSAWPNGIAFAVQGDKVVLLPADAGASLSFTLRLYYYRRPNRLIAAADAGLITAINSAVYTCGGGVGEVDDGDSVDLIEASPGFDWLAADVTAAVATNDITLPAAVSGAAVGDYIAEAGTSPVVQLPEALHPVLVNAVAMRVYELLGSGESAKLLQAKLERTLDNVASLINPRIEGEEIAIISHWSPLRAGRCR